MQKQSYRNRGIVQGINIMSQLANLAGAVPQVAEAFDFVDASELLKVGFEGGGVPQTVIREDEDVAKLRTARAEAQAAQMQQQQQMQALEVSSKAAANLGRAGPDVLQQMQQGAA
jgi:hypothetical protein